ncbi:replication protein a 70 kda dna-binding subunit d isoform x1 [Hordeum vulgare]|nr:replication protein a 70 kda dna-binding subunit d isoform x1 [Hordeum vulgare]
MYAEIPGNEAMKVKQLVQEHHVYCFKKFLVAPSKAAYKPFPGKYMIKFTPWTSVTHVNDITPDFPLYVYNLMPFSDLPSRIGAQDYFVDVIGQIVGVSQLAQIRMPSSSSDTPKRVIALRDNRNTEMKIVLWGQRAIEFEAQLVYDNGQQTAVVGVFVGLLMKSYKSYELLTGCMEAITTGGSLKFRQWLPTDELGFDVAEQRVRICITHLPLHVWSAAVVEHILAPYCGLEHITDHTHQRIDIHTYRCTAWAQHRIPIPDSILLCIPVTKPDPGKNMKTQEYRRLCTYRLKLTTRHYIYSEDEGPEYTPVTQVPRYENTYNTNEAICFLPPELVDEQIIKELSAAVVVPGNSKQADALWKDVYYLYPGLDPRDARIDALSSDKQIIIPPNNTTGEAIQKLILSTHSKDIQGLIPWSPDTGSIESTVNNCVELMNKRIPAHLCIEKLIKLLLAQFCYIELPDRNAELLLTSESYRCIAWCNDPTTITKNLIVKVVDSVVASTMILHKDPDVTVRTASTLIDVQRTTTNINELLAL